MRSSLLLLAWLLVDGSQRDFEVTQLTDKPRADSRLYQFAGLPNGIQVLNIQDPLSTQGAVGVSVRAGSMFEPKDLPGLAHFCEHMLFLGTKKFPDPTGFDKFLGESGGGSNAYTDQEVTVYYATFANRVFNEALERFADFFSEPLFNREFVEKEVHAINSEHEKNLQNPARRVLQVLNNLANPDSRVNMFATGNIETLITEPQARGVDVVDALHEYFRRSHCPQHLRVVTVAPQPLPEQLEKVRQSFGAVAPMATCFNKTFADPPAWPAERLSKFVVVEPSEPRAALWLQFAFPDMQKEFASKPLNYINYVLQYAGVGSLQNSLKNAGLIQDLSTAAASNSAGTRFFVSIYLTNKGARNVEHVMDVFFQYVAKMKQSGVNLDLYNSLADLSRLEFNWTQPDAPGNTVKDFAERMLRLPASQMISGDSRIDSTDPALVASLIQMLTPQNLILSYVPSTKKGNIFPEGSQVFEDKNMQLKYAVMPLHNRLPGAVERWSSWLSGSSSYPDGAPELPKAIQHIPKALDTTHMVAEAQTQLSSESFSQALVSSVYGAPPNLLSEGFGASQLRFFSEKAWYRSGWKTTSPKVSVDVAIRPYRSAHEAELSAKAQLEIMLFQRLFIRHITPLLADLRTTDQTASISLDDEGMKLSFEAFAPVLTQLIEKFWTLFNDFHLNETVALGPEFNWTKQELLDAYSTYADLPAKYAVQAGKVLVTSDLLSREEAIAGLSQAQPHSVMRSPGLVVLEKPLSLDALVMGNVDEKTAREAIGQIVESIKLPPWASPAEQPQGRLPDITPIALPAQPVEVRAPNPRPGDPNDVVLVKLLAGLATVENRAAFGVIGLILNNLIYSQLRTEEQLGYVVQGAVGTISNVLYAAALVQGTALSADDMEAAVEGVLWSSLPSFLQNLTAEDFDGYRRALLQQYLQPPSTIDEERKHFFGSVKHHGACFNLLGEVVQFANSSDFNKELLVKSWSELMSPSRGWRWKVSVKYFGRAVPPRPDAAAVQAALQKRGVPPSAVSQLTEEHARTMILDKADSAAREAITKGSGYFPAELHCQREGQRTRSFLSRRTLR